MLTDRESLAACSFYQFPLCCQQVVNKTSAGLLFVLPLGLQLRWIRGLMDARGLAGPAAMAGDKGHVPILLAWPQSLAGQQEPQGTLCPVGITPRK